MQTSENAIRLIKQFEGCSLTAYPDPGTGGKPYTIGYGHTSGVTAGDRITRAEAVQLLLDDLEQTEAAVNELVTVPLNQNQFDALASFTFNVGEGNLAHSTLLKKLNAGDYRGAADEFTRWVYADGKILPGLEKRRAAERELFLS